MRHFALLATGLDVIPAHAALVRQPGLWNQHPFRTAPAHSPHHQVDDILLRSQPGVADWSDHREMVWYPAWQTVPELQPLVWWLMARVHGERLGRCMVTRLAPGRRITPHRDLSNDGVHQEAYWSRHHICLHAPRESYFVAGEEMVIMAPGTCWWFDNQEEHAVHNEGAEDRVQLIVDIRLSTDVFVAFPAEGIPMTLVYTVETWTNALPEMEAHWKAHFDEVAIDHQAVPLDPDYERYARLEAAGELLVMTVRDAGTLVGYATVIVTTHLHNKRTLCGFMDLYYLAPAYRTGWAGMRLLRSVTETLRARGVVKAFSGTKLHLDVSVLFQRLQWRPTEQLYTILLQHQGDVPW